MSISTVINATLKQAPTEQWANLPASTYAVPGVIPTATGTQALTANTGIAMPFYLDRPIAFTSVAGLITTLSDTHDVRIGLYNWDPVARTLGSLVKDFGLITTDATGIVAIASTQTVGPGWYAWAVVSAGTPTLRSFLAAMAGVAGAYTISTTTALSVTHYTFDGTGMTAAGFAATGPAVTAVTSASVFTQQYLVLARFNAGNPAP